MFKTKRHDQLFNKKNKFFIVLFAQGKKTKT